MKEYILKKPAYLDSDKGPGRSGAPAPPGSALIYLKSNSGIEPGSPSENHANENREAVAQILETVPSRHRKKMYAVKERIEWLVKTYGINHVGLMTLTIRENVTDRKEFQRRFKSMATNVFPKIYEDWIRVFERQQRGAWHAHVVVATKADIRTGTEVAALNKLLKDRRDRKIPKASYYSGIQRLASSNLRSLWREFRRLCGVGVQVDVSPVATEAGIRFPVYLTRAIFDAYVAVPKGVTGQDEAGRLWDIVWMLRFAIRRAQPSQDRLPFALYVRNDNCRARLVKLVAHCGPLDFNDPRPAITVMMPEED